MLYHVSRNGQMYGPYTLDDLQRYVASGNVLPTDLAKSEEMPEWLPVAQVLGMPAMAYAAPAAYTQADLSAYPDPPNLPWGLVLLFSFFTCGVFMLAWNIVLAVWVRRIQPASQALFYYLAGAGLRLVNSGVTFGVVFAIQRHHLYRNHPFSSLIGLAGWVLALVALFSMRETMERHFNGPDPIGLRLSGVMTFFFGGLYFQYHHTRIMEIKTAMRYRGALQ